MPCATNLCFNNGTCLHDSIGQITCLCSAKYAGKFCEITFDPCSSVNCSNNGYCSASDNGRYACICKGELYFYFIFLCQIS